MLKTIIQKTKECIVFVMLLASIATIVYVSFSAGHEKGMRDGRAEFHNDLIKELKAKGGAPVLLYPPKNMEVE